jgi:preprotein translocase subunit YajC
MMDLLYRAAIFAQTNLPQPGTGGGEAAPGPAQGAPQAAPQQSLWSTLLFFGIMILIFYLLIFRPQQKKAKQQRELITALKRGDNVITNSGIYGRIAQIDDHTVSLEVDKNAKIRILKSHIAGLQANPAEGGSEMDANLHKGQ